VKFNKQGYIRDKSANVTIIFKMDGEYTISNT